MGGRKLIDTHYEITGLFYSFFVSFLDYIRNVLVFSLFNIDQPESKALILSLK